MFGYGKHVLAVDDDQSAMQETALLLERVGFMVVQASDGLDALNDMQQQHVDAVVTDSHMLHLNGLERLAQSRVIRSDTPVIIVSKAPWDMSDIAMAHGAFAWVRKSSDPGILLIILALAVGGPGVGIPSRNETGRWIGQLAHRNKEEQIMGTGNVHADEAILNMLQRYDGLMIEDVIAGQPDFSWAQLFLAIDRLSRKHLIALYRVGPTYQIRSTNRAWTLGQDQHHEELAASHR